MRGKDVYKRQEEPFFKDRIALIPQRQSETDQLAAITDAGNAILIPAVSP